MPPPHIGHRMIELTVKLYSNSTIPSNTHYLWFRFFDENTNQTIQHVSFYLTVTSQNQLLFRELFHTHTGILNVKVISTADPKWSVIAAHEPILNGWVPYNDNEPIVIHAPLFNDTNSTYHFNIQMFSMDSDNNILATTDNPDIVPNFNLLFNTDQNQTVNSQTLTVPEFPVAIPILLISIASLFFFYRVTTFGKKSKFD